VVGRSQLITTAQFDSRRRLSRSAGSARWGLLAVVLRRSCRLLESEPSRANGLHRFGAIRHGIPALQAQHLHPRVQGRRGTADTTGLRPLRRTAELASAPGPCIRELCKAPVIQFA